MPGKYGLQPLFMLSAADLTINAQPAPLPSPQPKGRVTINVVALDSAGMPVPDLAASEFKVIDNGSPQRILSMQLNQAAQPRPIVVLFDLLNAGETSRGAVWSTIKTSFAHLQPSEPLYLYLLVPDGSLYAVHGFPRTPAAPSPADYSWIRDIGPLLDEAMRKTTQVKPLEVRLASPVAATTRIKTTYRALDEMRLLMSDSPGSKDLLWVTYGVPSDVQLYDHSWFYGTPLLRQLGEQYVRSGITIYTADPGMNLQRGILNRNSLDILTSATGGRAFPTIDLRHAIARMKADARMKYQIEYQPPPANWDGKYHKLHVEVARKGVRLQAESGYYAVAGS